MLDKISLEMEKYKWLSVVNWRLTGSVVVAAFVVASLFSTIISYVTMPEAKSSFNHGSKVIAPRALNMKPTLSKNDIRKIIKRNIFSSDGELAEEDKQEKDKRKERAGEGAIKSDLPLKVQGIIYSGDPYTGIAIISNTEKRITNSFMVGEMVILEKNVELKQILFDRIILNNDGVDEFVLLEKKKIVRSKRKKKTGRSKKVGSRLAPIATKAPPENYKEEGFERVGREIVMTKEYKRKLMGPELAQILQDAKAEPYVVQGEFLGFKLTRVREGSFYEKAGLQNEDIVTEINGTALTGAGQAMSVLQSVKNGSEWEIRVNRGGNILTFNIRS